jgi:hypothetical protein
MDVIVIFECHSAILAARLTRALGTEDYPQITQISERGLTATKEVFT